MYQMSALTAGSESLMNRGDSILLGVSPFNRTYTPRSVRRLVAWACERFDQVHVLGAGHEAANRLIDAGVSARDAVRRTVRIVHELRCAARTALSAAGYPDPDRFVHVWTKLEERPRYRELLATAHRAYGAGGAFTRACQVETKKACRTWLDHSPSDAQIEHNVPYLLAEVPLFVDTPGILDMPTSVFAYHHEPPIVNALLDGVAPELLPANRQGFVIISAAVTSPTVTSATEMGNP